MEQINSYRPILDLAGEVCYRPTFWQSKTRINQLVSENLNHQKICQHLEDLPRQFRNPQPRPWSAIAWSDITSEQIIGINVSTIDEVESDR